MELTPYVERLRDEVERSADALGDDARALVDRLLGPLDAATRLILLDALGDACDEITRELAPGSVEVRLRSREPSFVVTPPDLPVADPDPVPTVDVGSLEDGATIRINLRLPDGLKNRVEEAASQQRLSLNAWLVRAAAAALVSGPGRAPGPSEARTPRRDQGYSGWVR